MKLFAVWNAPNLKNETKHIPVDIENVIQDLDFPPGKEKSLANMAIVATNIDNFKWNVPGINGKGVEYKAMWVMQ